MPRIKLSSGNHWINCDNHWKRIPHPMADFVTFLSLDQKYYIFDHTTESVHIVSRDGIEVNKDKPRRYVDKYSQTYIVNQEVYIALSVYFYEKDVPYYCSIHKVHPNINFVEIYPNINLELIIPVEENIYILQYYMDRPKNEPFWPTSKKVSWVKENERDARVYFVRDRAEIHSARIYRIGFRIPCGIEKFSFAYKNGGIFFLLQNLYFIQIYFLPLENLVRSQLFEEIFLDCIYSGNPVYFRHTNTASHITLIDNFPCTIWAQNQDIFIDSVRLVFNEHGSVLIPD